MMAENDNSLWLNLKKVFESNNSVGMQQLKKVFKGRDTTMPLNLTEMFEENNETFWKNLTQTSKRHEDDTEDFHYELDFVAPPDELKEVLELAVIYAFVLNIFILPDTEEYDFATDYLLFCKKIHENITDAEADQIPLVFCVSKRELDGVNFALSEGTRILSRDVTVDTADKTIMIESFRRRILKAAGIDLDDI
jgi:hypothetical protein